MKTHSRLILFIFSLLFLDFGASDVRAQSDFVGLWNFDDADLSATAGKDSHSEAADQAAAFYRLAK